MLSNLSLVPDCRLEKMCHQIAVSRSSIDPFNRYVHTYAYVTQLFLYAAFKTGIEAVSALVKLPFTAVQVVLHHLDPKHFSISIPFEQIADHLKLAKQYGTALTYFPRIAVDPMSARQHLMTCNLLGVKEQTVQSRSWKYRMVAIGAAAAALLVAAVAAERFSLFATLMKGFAHFFSNRSTDGVLDITNTSSIITNTTNTTNLADYTIRAVSESSLSTEAFVFITTTVTLGLLWYMWNDNPTPTNDARWQGNPKPAGADLLPHPLKRREVTKEEEAAWDKEVAESNEHACRGRRHFFLRLIDCQNIGPYKWEVPRNSPYDAFLKWKKPVGEFVQRKLSQLPPSDDDQTKLVTDLTHALIRCQLSKLTSTAAETFYSMSFSKEQLEEAWKALDFIENPNQNFRDLYQEPPVGEEFRCGCKPRYNAFGQIRLSNGTVVERKNDGISTTSFSAVP